MTRKNLFFGIALIALCSSFSYGQTFGQDAEGFSSIIAPSALLNLDLANEVASFSYYGLVDSKNLLGGEIKGKSENGISNLFSESKVVSNASLSLLYGYYLSSSSKDGKNYKKFEDAKASLRTQTDIYESQYNSLLVLLGKYEKEGVIDGTLKRGLDLTLQTGTLQELKVYLEKVDVLLTAEKVKEKKVISKISALDSLRTSLSKLILTKPKLGILRTEKDKIDNVKKYSSTLVYTRWSSNGLKFKEDKGQEFSSVNDRFPKATFNGWKGEIGINYHSGDNFFGVNLSGNYTSNVGQLTEKEFTLTTEDDTIETGLLKTSTNIKAYELDKFDEFHRYDFSFDYAYLIDIKGSEKLYLSLNPYLRHSVFHNSKDFKNSTNLGVGLFAFNASESKVLGGAFIQGNDVFGVNDKPDTDLTTFDRFSFGLVVRVAFSGIDIKAGE